MMKIVSIIPCPCKDLPLVKHDAARRWQYQSTEYPVDRPIVGTRSLHVSDEILEDFLGAR
jgi:hypothetical protein